MHPTDERPDAVRSDPVPVPPPDDQAEHDRIPHQLDADHAADNRVGWDGATVNDADRDGLPDADDTDASRTDADAGSTDTDTADADAGPTDADRDADGVPDAYDPDADAGSTDADRDAMPGHADDADASLADRGTFDDPVVADADRDADQDGVPDAVDADAGQTDADAGPTDTDTRDADVDAGPTDTDRDADGVPDAYDPDAADQDAMHGHADDADASVADRDGELFTTPAAADTDADRDGVPDTVDAEYADRSGNPDPDTVVQNGGTYADPVVASPVEVDADRADAYAEPGLAETALGGAAAGAAAGAAVGMAGDRRDDDTVVEDGPTEMKPGDAEAVPVVTLMSADSAQGFRDRWRDVQLRFVDDPRGAATEAQSLAEEAVEALVTAISNHKNDLGGWQTTEAGDTEQLRMVVRRYRDLLDRVLGS